MIAVSLKKLPHAEQSAHAHSMLAECLESFGVSYVRGVTPMTYGKLGKPSLAERPDLHFNLSHAEGVTACIVSDSECGIDCECVRPCRMRVAKRAFSPQENARLENAEGEERDMLFFRIWTLKEAYVKALGTGISYPMNSVTIMPEGEGIFSDAEGWHFAQYIINGRAIVSVCESKPIPQTVTYMDICGERFLL